MARSLPIRMLVLASWALAGCAVAPPEGSEADQEALAGARLDTKHPAIGALATRTTMGQNGEIIEAFCTGTLIAPRLVLTAEHCFARGHTKMAFVLGPRGSTILVPERLEPERLVDITNVEVEREVEGGGLGLGSDVAIAELAEPITDIEPVAIGYLGAGDVGTKFEAVGYGVHDIDARGDGQKRTGTTTLRALEGKYLPLAYPRFEDYVRRTGLTPTEARAEYEGFELLAGYEAYTGGKRGDAQGCEGDSGGPLLRKVGGKETVFGVASFVLWTRQSPCEGGTIYAAFGPKARALIEAHLPR